MLSLRFIKFDLRSFLSFSAPGGAVQVAAGIGGAGTAAADAVPRPPAVPDAAAGRRPPLLERVAGHVGPLLRRGQKSPAGWPPLHVDDDASFC